MGISSSRPHPPTEFRCQLNGGRVFNFHHDGRLTLTSPHRLALRSVHSGADGHTAGSTAHPSSTTPGVRTPSHRVILSSNHPGWYPGWFVRRLTSSRGASILYIATSLVDVDHRGGPLNGSPATIPARVQADDEGFTFSKESPSNSS
jgi:hypothetical protein